MQHFENAAEPQDTKGKYLSPRWYGQLVAGRFSFGDTFFAGMFGPAFILVPAGFVIAAFVKVAAPAQMALAILLMTLVYALHFTATLPAVCKTGFAAKGTGGWRWFGMLLAIGATAALWISAYKFYAAL